MNAFAMAVSTEFLKARRSKVPWSIAAGFSLAPIVGGLFMVILKDPDRARQLGLIGTKAQLTAGVADWPTFLGLLAQAVAVGGGVLFAFLTAWIFGREFADRTIRVLLAIPTPRWAIVMAKSVVVATWCGAISAWVITLGFGIGLVIGLPGWSADMALHAIGTIALAAVLTTFSRRPRPSLRALVAATFRLWPGRSDHLRGPGPGCPRMGRLVPLGGAAARRGRARAGREAATAASFVVVALAALVGLAATVAWWRADQTG